MTSMNTKCAADALLEALAAAGCTDATIGADMVGPEVVIEDGSVVYATETIDHCEVIDTNVVDILPELRVQEHVSLQEVLEQGEEDEQSEQHIQ